MKQFKVISFGAIVYREPDLNSDQVDSLPVGLFVEGMVQGRWVALATGGYVLTKYLQVIG